MDHTSKKHAFSLCLIFLVLVSASLDILSYRRTGIEQDN
eukprot:GSA25T00007527001.1